MKMKYIKPVILYCYDIDMSIMTATLTSSETVSGSGDGKNGSNVSTQESGEEPPGSTKGTSWNLWEDEEENSFY